MKDRHGSQNMDNFSSKRRNNYGKEMDHAFTLIFHNIKRLQDGHLSNSSPTLERADSATRLNPAMTLQVPAEPRERSGSDPSMLRKGLSQGIQKHSQHLELTRPKSRSFCGEGISPTQRRKVRFFDDCATNEHTQKRPPLTRRALSDVPPKPTIVVSNESWNTAFSLVQIMNAYGWNYSKRCGMLVNHNKLVVNEMSEMIFKIRHQTNKLKLRYYREMITLE